MTDETDTSPSSADALASALDLVGGRHRAIRKEPPSTTLRGNQREIRAQFEALAASRRIAVFDRTRLGTRLDGGGEHEIFLAEDISCANRWRVYKETHTNHAGQCARAVVRVDGLVRVASDDATPAEYLERMLLHNEIFGDEIRLEGLGIDENADTTSLVISQPYIKGNIPSRSDADEFLSSSGFTQAPDGFWFSAERGVGIVDTKPANFIQTADRGIYPIDLVIFIPTLAMLDVWNLSV